MNIYVLKNLVLTFLTTISDRTQDQVQSSEFDLVEWLAILEHYESIEMQHMQNSLVPSSSPTRAETEFPAAPIIPQDQPHNIPGDSLVQPPRDHLEEQTDPHLDSKLFHHRGSLVEIDSENRPPSDSQLIVGAVQHMRNAHLSTWTEVSAAPIIRQGQPRHKPVDCLGQPSAPRDHHEGQLVAHLESKLVRHPGGSVERDSALENLSTNVFGGHPPAFPSSLDVLSAKPIKYQAKSRVDSLARSVVLDAEPSASRVCCQMLPSFEEPCTEGILKQQSTKMKAFVGVPQVRLSNEPIPPEHTPTANRLSHPVDSSETYPLENPIAEPHVVMEPLLDPLSALVFPEHSSNIKSKPSRYVRVTKLRRDKEEASARRRLFQAKRALRAVPQDRPGSEPIQPQALAPPEKFSHSLGSAEKKVDSNVMVFPEDLQPPPESRATPAKRKLGALESKGAATAVFRVQYALAVLPQDQPNLLAAPLDLLRDAGACTEREVVPQCASKHQLMPLDVIPEEWFAFPDF